MKTGKVGSLPTVNDASTNSSKEMVKATRKAASIAGAIMGITTRRRV